MSIPSDPPPSRRRLRAAALGVHLLTATGVVWAFLALMAAAEGRPAAMFLWLALAMLVDTVDGPLARALAVPRTFPRYDGVTLDLIVDYLTYVFVPAFALARSDLLPPVLAPATAGVICLTAALYFADTGQKAQDNHFRGFPGLWNLVVFLAFLYSPPAWVLVPAVAVCAVLTFVPADFVHPVRVERWRPLTLAIAALTSALAIFALVQDFAPSAWVKTAIGLAVLYWLALGAWRTLERLRERETGSRGSRDDRLD